MRTFLITGVAGYIGTLLAKKLAAGAASRVVGIDLREPVSEGPLTFYRADINDRNALREILGSEGADTLIHLACYSAPEGDEEEAFRVNVEGTQAVLAAALERGVPRLVVPTSTAAYGSHRDNPVPLSESDPLRGNEGFYYSRHKEIQDRLCTSFMKKHPEVEVVVLRPCALLGPHLNNQTGTLLNSPILVVPLAGRNTPLQFIHEEDASEAFRRAATGGATGVFNLAPAGTLTVPGIAEIAERKLLCLPYGVLSLLVVILKKLSLSPVGEKSLKFGLHPIVADGTKFNRAFDFTPRYDTAAAVKEFYRHWAALKRPR